MSKRILIVDDEPNIVVSLEFLMKREGFEVAVAADGEAALRSVEEKKPDLVLLDIMLPKKNGFEVCQTIRANPEWQSIKVVMLTAKGRDTEVAKGTALGADAYMTKPFSTKDLIAQVRQMLGVDGWPENPASSSWRSFWGGFTSCWCCCSARWVSCSGQT